MILIKNLKNEKPIKPWQIRVDRTSILGNPLKMNNYSNEERDRVCNEYEKYFYEMLNFTSNILDFEQNTKKINFKLQLNNLCTLYKQYGKLELFCWCAPKRCHAETIRNYILNESFLKKLKNK